MREPRNQFEKIADTITGWSSRRQRAREPRVLVYDGNGRPRRIRPENDAHADIVELAERLVALTDTREDGAPAE